jgi:hypothetical protein
VFGPEKWRPAANSTSSLFCQQEDLVSMTSEAVVTEAGGIVRLSSFGQSGIKLELPERLG